MLGQSSIYNVDLFYSPFTNTGLVDDSFYVSQVTVRYIVTTTDGLCGPIEIENDFSVGCKFDGGETVNGTYQACQNVDSTLDLHDARKCSTDII